MEKTDKIVKIEELAGIIKQLRNRGKKVVHCHGVFDLLHIGHIRYFEQAKLMGDVLVVTVTPDCYVDKGPHRPAFTDLLRAEAIASLSVVDFVAVNQWPTAEETLRLLKPDFYVKGSEFKNTSSDMTGKIGREEEVVKEIGATLVFTEDIVFSSSNLINRYLSTLSEEIQQYLNLFRQRYTIEEVWELIDRMASLNVLVIGDTILDEYQYCEAIGKSSKDPTLALKYVSQDRFAGGALAVANHVANFANRVHLITVLGDQDRQEEFIRKQLHPKVVPHFATKKNAPTLIKRRFIDNYSFNKLFEVYIMDDSNLSSEEETNIFSFVNHEINQCDLVIAADFGHGAINKNITDLLVDKAPFLAVNTQANAGNRGFNTIARYGRADYACLAEHEIRLEMRDLDGNLRGMMEKIGTNLNCRHFVVTRGRKGCLIWGKQGEFVGIPSFAQKVVDRVGAGDAFLSVTALGAVIGAPDELIGFIGNIVGGLAVEVIGNQKSIDKLSVNKFVTSLLK